MDVTRESRVIECDERKNIHEIRITMGWFFFHLSESRSQKFTRPVAGTRECDGTNESTLSMCTKYEFSYSKLF